VKPNILAIDDTARAPIEVAVANLPINGTREKEDAVVAMAEAI
jgi:hypothetical protein